MRLGKKDYSDVKKILSDSGRNDLIDVLGEAKQVYISEETSEMVDSIAEEIMQKIGVVLERQCESPIERDLVRKRVVERMNEEWVQEDTEEGEEIEIEEEPEDEIGEEIEEVEPEDSEEIEEVEEEPEESEEIEESEAKDKLRSVSPKTDNLSKESDEEDNYEITVRG